MRQHSSQNWRFDRQINVAVLVQLALVGCLIVGSWVNLQRQLGLLQRDVGMLVNSQKVLEKKLETLSAKSMSYEYRLQALEKGRSWSNSSPDDL